MQKKKKIKEIKKNLNVESPRIPIEIRGGHVAAMYLDRYMWRPRISIEIRGAQYGMGGREGTTYLGV